MESKARIDKFMSREFFGPIVGVAILTAAFFAKPDVQFNDFAFWLSMVLGVSVGGVALPKTVAALRGSK